MYFTLVRVKTRSVKEDWTLMINIKITNDMIDILCNTILTMLDKNGRLICRSQGRRLGYYNKIQTRGLSYDMEPRA